MQKKKKVKKENSERWLLTYSDLITLLMILFIVLFAISNVNQDKYERLAASLNEAMGGGNSILSGSTGIIGLDGGGSGLGDEPAQVSTPTPTPTPTPTVMPSQTPGDEQGQGQSGEPSGSITNEKEMKNLQSYIQDIVDNLKIGDYVSTSVKSNGMFITFSNDVFFDSGDDTLKDEMKKGLDKLSVLLNRIDNTIIVEGHTDNVPMNKSSKFSTNWQLSAARAANVVEYLVDSCKIDGTRISAVGYGEYHPKASNKTEKGRSENRRIEVVILYN